MEKFFHSHQHILWTDYSILNLPDFITTQLEQCTIVDHIDRYLIFTDGSSQAKHRHRPPEWVADFDISDSWAFIVLAEQYGSSPTLPSKIQFLGFHCQQVLYEQEAPHYIGTQRVGSDASETEALFWAGLWRLAENNSIATVFISDSRLVGDQAAGRVGSRIHDEPFCHLRATFQALEACLPGDLLRVEHVRSHAGDPFNELADFLAKQEAQSSLYLPRQRVDMNTFKYCLRNLWMAVDGQVDLPVLSKQGYDVSFASLPQVQQPGTCSPTPRLNCS